MTTKDIFVYFNDQIICLPGLTRFTTCDDVIEMVLYGTRENYQSFGVFESSRGIERRLSGRDSILKVLRSWRSEQRFDLIVKKINRVNSKLITISQAKRKLEKMRNAMVQRSDGNSSDTSTVRNNLNKKTAKIIKPKVVSASAFGPRNRGKVDLMKRFLHDVMTQQDKQTIRVSLPKRRSGDGCSFDQGLGNRYVSGKSSCSEVFKDEKDIPNKVVSNSESAFEDASDCSSVCDLERNILEHDVESSSDVTDKANSTAMRSERIKKLFSGSYLTGSGSDDLDADMESFMKSFVCESDSDTGRGSSVE